MTAGDTPERILSAAGELFARHGYRATSMRAIADRVGITKAALYYHFPAKRDLLDHLTSPLLDELEDALRLAESAPDPESVRWRAVEGCLDVYLRHRDTLLMLIRDMTLLVEAPVADRFKAATALANDLVAGPSANLRTRVRAAQAVAGLGDVVLLFADVPPGRVRALVLSGVRDLLREPAVPGTSARGGGGGRPRALSAEQIATARRWHAESVGADEIADRLGVSRATVYRVLKIRL